MGWNTFKKHFNIGHIVQIRERDLLIGSPYISDLAAISMDTGMIKKRDHSSLHARFLREYYSPLSDAMPSELEALLDAEDTFTQSIPVYTYEGLRISTKYCEEIGYPNVTHDGWLMYDNTFLTDIEAVVEMAILERVSRLENLRERITERSKELQELQDKLALLEKEEIVFE